MDLLSETSPLTCPVVAIVTRLPCPLASFITTGLVALYCQVVPMLLITLDFPSIGLPDTSPTQCVLVCGYIRGAYWRWLSPHKAVKICSLRRS